MSLFSVVYFFVFLLSFFSETSVGCKFVDEVERYAKSVCRYSKNFTERYIMVDGRRVSFGKHDVRIPLEEPSKEARYSCGHNFDTFTWAKAGNQLRVSYLQYVVHVKAYWCDTFDGPKRAGLRCAVEAFSSACPGRVSDNHTCVFEVKTHSFSSETVRKAVEVKTEVAVTVREKAKISTGVTHNNERTRIHSYTVDSRSYIIIPAGYRFCSFSEVYSIKEYLAATGFTWECYAPTFVQTTAFTGRCTDLALCKTKSPCSNTGQTSRSGKKSADGQLVAMTLALCMIVGSNLPNLL